MRYLLTLWMFALLIVTNATSSQEQLISVCSNFKGYTYLLPSPINPTHEDTNKFVEDEMTGNVIILGKIGDDYDILFKDFQGEIKSTVEEGGRIVELPSADGVSKILLVFYNMEKGMTTEQYYFKIDTEGRGVCVLQGMRSTGYVNSTRIVSGKCSNFDELQEFLLNREKE